MPLPSQDEIAAIEAIITTGIENDSLPPTAPLSLDQRRLLVTLCRDDLIAFDAMRDRLHAIASRANWSSGKTRQYLGFNDVRQTVANQRRSDQDARQQMNVLRLATQRDHSRRQAMPQADATGGMTAEQWIDTQAPALIVKGHLAQRRAGRIWFDSFFKRGFADWRGEEDDETVAVYALDDQALARMANWLREIDPRLAKISKRAMGEFIVDAAHLDQRNAPREWLHGLAWDQVPRLHELFSRGFGARDSEFNREAGRCWIVSMVARIMEPGCKVDTMPVLSGGQGLMKSQALEVIGGDWYRASSSNIDSKDFLQELHSVMLLEIPELHSLVASRHGAARVKAVLSIRADHFRLPYGHLVEDHLRTCVLVGTTNDRNWHNDTTGGRRFWVVYVTDIDLDWLRAYRDQLFAEALHLWRNDGQWWNVPHAEQEELMEAERVIDPWEDTIAQRLDEPGLHDGTMQGAAPRQGDGGYGDAADWGTLVTVNRVGYVWLRMSPENLGRPGYAQRIGAILRRLGWQEVRRRIAGRVDAVSGNRRVRYWVRAEAAFHEGDAEPAGHNEQPIGNDADEIPF